MRALELDARLAAVFPSASLYAVGGRVRDEVRSRLDGIDRPAKDLDYVVVGVPFDDVVARLRTIGSADVVGASFAVVKATIDGVTVDVALPRRERSTGVDHRAFVVETGPEISLGDDLARRDFRMNMLARAIPEGDLIDPYGGVGDILARRVDILRAEAFEEDPLRMLRACQFAARFEFAIAPGTMSAMRAAAPLVATVSPERVRDELEKFLTAAPRPSRGIELLAEAGLLELILPEVAEGIGVAQNVYHAYDVYRHNLVTLDAVPPGDGVLRLAALLHDVGKPRTREVLEDGTHFYRHEQVGAELARGLLERLRFPLDTVSLVERLVRHHMYAADPKAEPRTVRRFLRRIGVDALDRQFALRAADIVGSGLPKRGDENERFEALVREELARKPALSVRDLRVDGNDVLAVLIAAGVLPSGSRGGPHVGRILAELLETVTEFPERNERTVLLEAIRELVALQISATGG